MKHLIKSTLTLIGLSLFANASNAQNFHVGIKAGATIYNNSGKDISGKFNAFPFGGAYLGVSGEKMSLIAEGIFTQTRMVAGDNFNQVFNNYIRSGKDQVRNAEFSFSELSVPVLVGFKALPFTWFEIGPQFTKIVSMNDKDEVLNEITNVHKDSYVSAVIGARIKLPLGLHVTGRYVMGLSNRNNSSVSERWTTQHFQVGVGFGL